MELIKTRNPVLLLIIVKGVVKEMLNLLVLFVVIGLIPQDRKCAV
jgi:hypothetical protein